MSTPAPWGEEFLVNTNTFRVQSAPSIAALANGRFVVAWTDNSGASGDPGRAVRAQMFNADGSTFGKEVLVNTTTVDSQEMPAVVALPNGDFVIAWSTNGQT